MLDALIAADVPYDVGTGELLNRYSIYTVDQRNEES